MAPSPVFVASTALLQSKLRLSGMKPGANGEAIFLEALGVARALFLRRLGSARVIVLRAIPFVEDTLDDTGMLRVLANTTEVKIVRRELMRSLKNLFLDAGGGGTEAWNEESPFREMDDGQVTAEIARLDEEIENALEILGGTSLVESGVRATTYEPDETPPRPYDSIRSEEDVWL